MKLRQFYSGFTLAEVLIALALLGVIAAFSIPKVLMVVQNQQRSATLKEAMALLTQISIEGQMSGEYTASSYPDYLFSRLNNLKECPINSSTQGCWTWAGGVHDGGASEVPRPGFVLPNRAVIVGFDAPGPGVPADGQGRYLDGVVIDWNGAAGPNQTGQDQMHFAICYGKSGTITVMGVTCKVPGIARSILSAASQPLWNGLYDGS